MPLSEVGCGHCCELRVGSQGICVNRSIWRHHARVHVAGSRHEETMWPFVASQAEDDGTSQKAQIRSELLCVFHSCKSVQSSNVIQHLASKHQSVTDAKVIAGRRQETGFAHAASTDVRTGIRKLLSDAPNTKALKHVMQRYAMLPFYLYTRLPMSIFRVHTRTEGHASVPSALSLSEPRSLKLRLNLPLEG